MKGGWRFKPTASVVCLFNIFTTLQPCWRIACIEGLTPHTGYQPMHRHYIIKVAICKYFAQIPINDKGGLEVKNYNSIVSFIQIYHDPPTRLASIKIVIYKQHYIPTHIKTKYILSKILPPQKPRFHNKFPTTIYHTRPPLVIANIAPNLFTLPAPPVIKIPTKRQPLFTMATTVATVARNDKNTTTQLHILALFRPPCHCKPAWQHTHPHHRPTNPPCPTQHIIAHTLKQSNFPAPSPKTFPQLQ